MTIAILYRDELKEYDFGPGHPFRGDRYEIFPGFLKDHLSPDDNYRILSASPATDDDLLTICDRDYIDFNRDYFQAVYSGWNYFYENLSRYQSVDNRPIGTPGKLEEAARLIVGQAKMACDLVQSGEYLKAFSIGGGMHHAKRRFGEGFCIYNDVAFAVTYLLEKYKLQKIMVLDTDAHAGNGTAEYFNTEPRVLFVDIHQDPRTIYPGTGFTADVGAEAGKGFTVNIPLPVYAGDDSYKMVLEELVSPLAREYQPQILIRNGGSDPHFNDGITYLGMTINGFRMMGDKIRDIAEVCQGRLIDLMASGYNKTILPYAWTSLMSGIAGLPAVVEEPEPVPAKFQQDQVLDQTEQVVAEVKKVHSYYWKCFR